MASKSEQMDSMIGEGSVFEGRFNVLGSLRVDGKFEGQVNVENKLIVGETGKIKTNVSAKEVIVSGTFIGNIIASEKVVIFEAGKVLGDITTPFLDVHKGAITLGKIEITSNKHDSDGIHQIIEESFAGSPINQSLLPNVK